MLKPGHKNKQANKEANEKTKTKTKQHVTKCSPIKSKMEHTIVSRSPSFVKSNKCRG